MKKILFLLLVLLLVSCTTDYTLDEEVVEDVSNKITETLINTVGNDNVKRLETHTIDASSLNKINIENAVGDIYITTHESKDAVIDVNLVAVSNSREKAEEIINNFKYTVEEKWNIINVNTTEFSDNFVDGDGLKTNISIKLPSTIENIVISTNVGEVKIENVKAKIKANSNVGDIIITNSDTSYNLKVDVGDIKIKDSIASGKSDFNINTGDINLKFNDIFRADNIYAETQVGNISLTLPISSDYEAEINEFMKDKKVESNGNGNTKIKLTANVGKIDF